jgi:hypothetical protein
MFFLKAPPFCKSDMEKREREINMIGEKGKRNLSRTGNAVEIESVLIDLTNSISTWIVVY